MSTLLQDLYAKICGVSYIGDVRMGFAEDSRKTERIARGSAEGLGLMYNKRLQVNQNQVLVHAAALAACLMVNVASACFVTHPGTA